MRVGISAVVAIGALALGLIQPLPCCAQNATSGALAGPTTFAAPMYGPARDASSPRTAYDHERNSVFIFDGAAPRGAGPLPPGISMTGGNPSMTNAAAPVVYAPHDQFALYDAPQTVPTPAPVVYDTIGPPALPPGAVLPDCFDYSCEAWHWQLLPQGLIWHSYLAGPEEPRLAAVIFDEQSLGVKWDGTLGARVGLLRYGNSADFRPQGWQLDVESAAFIRQDPEEKSDVDGYDFRIGFPVTYGWGRYQMKLEWYHMSAHLGDEYAAKHPTFTRINFSRNAIVWGHSFYPTDALRIYGEVDYGYWTDGGNEPWAFQFGFEYSPVVRGFRGAPFLAVNGLLREENDFGGPLTVQTGWQWRGLRGGQLIRVGFHYQTGPSTLDEFFTDSETQIGGGAWYDF